VAGFEFTPVRGRAPTWWHVNELQFYLNILKEQVDAGGGGMLPHDLVGAMHTAVGLTAGHVLRAIAPDSFVFAAIQAGDLPDLSGTYAVVGHNHDGAYSALGHHHDAAYAALGHHHDAVYLGIAAKAADSDKLDNLDSTAFALAGHNHAGVYLGIDATAADSNLLGGLMPGYYALYEDLTIHAENYGLHVTNGDAHDHAGGDGGQIAYGSLSGTPDLSSLHTRAHDIMSTSDHSPVPAEMRGLFVRTSAITGAITISGIGASDIPDLSATYATSGHLHDARYLKLVDGVLGSYIDVKEVAAPAAPAADTARLYARDDGGTTKLYYKRSDDTEVEMGGSGTPLVSGLQMWEASHSGASDLTLTTVEQDVTGATLTLQPGKYWVQGVFDFAVNSADTNGTTCIGVLSVGGVKQTPAVTWSAINTHWSRATVSQVWPITVVSANTVVKLRAYKVGNFQTAQCYRVHTRIAAHTGAFDLADTYNWTGQHTITNSNASVLRVNRSTTGNGILEAAKFTHKTSAVATDGDGCHLSLGLQSTSGTAFDNTLVQLGAIRSGANDTGNFVVKVNKAGLIETGLQLWNGGSLGIHGWNNDPSIYLRRSAGPETAPAACASGAVAGLIYFQAYTTASQILNVARIAASVDGTPGTNDAPGRLGFATCPDGSSTLYNRMVIWNSGAITMYGGVNGSVGTAPNTKNLAGLTIFNGDSDDSILSFKNADVSHGMTDLQEDNTFCYFSKADAAAGGCAMVGFTEQSIGVMIVGRYTVDSTGHTSTGRAAVEVQAQKKSLATVGACAANQNLFAVRNYDATKFIVDNEGDVFWDGTSSTYDTHDDAKLVADLAQVLAGKHQNVKHYDRQHLKNIRLIDYGEDGRPFVSMKATNQLAWGAIKQLDGRLDGLEPEVIRLRRRVEVLESEIALLKAG
jgi:hypothetical protein